MKGSEISNKKIKFNYNFSKKEGCLIRGELKRQTEKLNRGIQVNNKPNQTKQTKAPSVERIPLDGYRQICVL